MRQPGVPNWLAPYSPAEYAALASPPLWSAPLSYAMSCVPQHVRRSVLLDRRDDVDPLLVCRLHCEEAILRMLIQSVDVDQFVMHIAQEHQVIDVV